MKSEKPISWGERPVLSVWNGAIARKHGNTLIGTLRKIYGRGFAPRCNDDDTLSDVLDAMHEASLSQPAHDHCERKINHGNTGSDRALRSMAFPYRRAPAQGSDKGKGR